MSLRLGALRHRTSRTLFSCPPCHEFLRNRAKRYASATSQSPSAAQEPSQDQGVRVTAVFRALIVLGIGSTAYGLYEFYNVLTLWPPEVRGDLRSGLKARNQGDLVLSERYLRRAYQTALSLPASVFDPSPYLKLSGIAITLASVLEADNRPKEAWDVYVQALSLPQPSPTPPSPSLQNAKSALPKKTQPTPQETMRQVSIAHKLGEMAETYRFGEAEEEKWLTWGVERLLESIRDHGVTLHSGLDGKSSEEQQQEKGGEETRVVLADLDLPDWVTKTDLGAPLEALAAFYARQGKVDYAMPLYLQAISLLIPNSPGQTSSIEDRCRGAQIMNNVSSLVMSKPLTPATLAQAESWARISAAVCGQEINSSKLKKGSKDQLSVCETTLAVALFNIASLREMANDRVAAKELFSNSLDQSRRIGMKEGIMEAQVALRRLDKAGSTSSLKPNPPT